VQYFLSQGFKQRQEMTLKDEISVLRETVEKIIVRHDTTYSNVLLLLLDELLKEPNK